MPLQVFNTATRKKGEFHPLRGKVVRIYSCGLTVYDYGHIGNFRSYIFADLLRRYLEYKGYDVKQVMNFTDVGHMTQDDIADSKGQDKMEKAAEREHKTPWEIADFYIKAFLEDSKILNLKEPDVRPKATDHITEMQEIIKKLIENGYAYVVNGDVYFEVGKFKGYGKLSGNTLENLRAGAGGRIEKNPNKKNPLDFALWIQNPKHIMKWKSPWGEGYPGWHIECSAMSTKYLGETFDIHTGGEDNIFPHHECEIAQTEGATGKKFVNYWLHARHLLVNGEKMSKSKGNFYTLRGLIAKGFKPMQIRYALMSAHYRQPLDFSLEGLEAAKNSLDRLEDFLRNLKKHLGPEKNDEVSLLIKTERGNFEKYMDDDLNTPEALASLFEFVKEINKLTEKSKLGEKNIAGIKKMFSDFDKVLGLELGKEKTSEGLDKKLIELVKELTGEAVTGNAESLMRKIIKLREAYRRKKDFKKSDLIRNKLKEIGVVLEDENGTTAWKAG